MELPDIGQQCTYELCNQLDFLPLQCDCGEIFCSEHFHYHISNCVTEKITNDMPKKCENLYLCSELNCKVKTVIPLLCTKCMKHFCIEHRHLTVCKEKSVVEVAQEKEKFSIPVRQFNDAKSAVDAQIERSLCTAKQNHKKQETAMKIQLMRMKNKATGQKSIPLPDRVYFGIEYVDVIQKYKAVFVSIKWSVGKVIDAVAEECTLPNNNHKSTSKKLRLYKKMDQSNVCNNLAVSVEKLLSDNILINGEDLIISYVDN
ncbi:AN1-type zinc finger protein 1-like [Cylas formicarius]|uniref:AN1-type zinc finger protein 1-like n=1 Tax=Cylas formicarius TaxID=197179 RepID=UPI002958C1BD|nr:AN1-type zinc finger protein 1-like [Cylas formicarius]